MLENDVKDKWNEYEGIYTFQGFSNEIDYWVDAEGENAIWFYPDYKDWLFGHDLGSPYAGISSVNNLETKCPNNEGNVLSWSYWDGSSWTATNDVYIKCAGE